MSKGILTVPVMSQTQDFSAQALRQLLAWGLPFIILIFFLILVLQSDPYLPIPTLVGATAVIVIVLAVVLYAGEKDALSWSPGVIIMAAAVFRILFLFRAPELSDDLYRYLWDGMQVLNGHNPFLTAPSEILPRDEVSYQILKHVNHPELITIYPPAAQFIFAAGAYLSDTFWGLKIILVMMDLVTCAFIIKLLSFLGLPAWRAALYAWHPLPILEIGSSGHIDGAGIFFLFLTLVLLLAPAGTHAAESSVDLPFQSHLKRRFLTFLAGLAFAWAVLVKLFPLLYLPGLFMFVRKHCGILFLTGFLTGVTTLALPFLPYLKNIFVTLGTYVQNWEFAGLAFRSLRGMTSSGDSARLILASVFLFSAAALYGKLRLKTSFVLRSGAEGCSNDASENYRSTPLDRNYLLTIISTLYTITMLFLFLTPTFHPWYALYLVCLLPFTAGVAGLVLTWSVFLSYRVLILYKLNGQWIETDVVPLVIWLAPVSAFLLVRLARKLTGSIRHRAA